MISFLVFCFQGEKDAGAKEQAHYENGAEADVL